MYYCGWDGGGTKTEICLNDGRGTVIGQAVFGPLNPNGASRETVLKTVRDALDHMAAQPGGLAACGGLVIGMAGISNESARAFLSGALSEQGYRGNLRLLGDQEIALAGAVCGPGAILIAGTGSVCFGRDAAGNPFRSGGYGYLIDDCGSGYFIGRDILAAVVRAEDGRGPETVLTGAVFGALGVSKVPEMITWLYSPETGKKEIAALARLLLPALEQKDPAAVRIADRAAEELSCLALAAFRKAGLHAGELALAGSILTRCAAIRQGVTERVQRELPGVRVTAPRRPASYGAARLAETFFQPCSPS